MRVRVSLAASVSAALFAGCGFAHAQDIGGHDRGSSPNLLPPTMVYPATPLTTPGAGFAADKVPSSINVVGAGQIERSASLNVTDALRQSVPAVAIGEVAGNPFQPNVEFRGFVGSPVAGTPQGLAVYQNGVRINEAFGDTVNWDLIPTAAIRSIALVTNNPAFGLNALGGAIAIQMKDGFGYQGAAIDTMGGSFGRIQGSAQWGRAVDQFAVYGALEGVHDDGFRNFSQSDIRRFYSDVGYRSADAEVHLNAGVAGSKFGASGTVPIELLRQNWGATYTTPQTTANQVAYANLSGKADVTPSWTVQAIAHLRAFNQQTVDGNPTATQPCTTDATLLCFGDGSTPANGFDGNQLANPFAANAILGEIDRTTTRSATGGFSIAATNTDDVFGHGNRFVVGTSLDSGVTHFNGSPELGTVAPNYVVTGSSILLGQSGNPVSIAPVSLRTTNQYTGIYALDTFDVTKAFSITAGGRFNDARIALQDQIGTALNGNETFDRFNPIIGGTYRITPELTAYAGYSEANRAPTPLELGCADPTRPCIIATFLTSDPPLKQVVSRTVEAGLRGSKELNFGTLNWKLGGFPPPIAMTSSPFPAPCCRDSALFKTSAEPAARASRPKPGLRHRPSSFMPVIRWSTRVSSMRCSSAPTARLPIRMATSKSCPAIRSRPSPVIASSSGSTTRSPMRPGLAPTCCMSAASFLSETNPTRQRSCRLIRCSTFTAPIRSTRRFSSTAGSAICSITATRPTAPSSTSPDCPTSPMAAWRSPTHAQ